MRVQELFKFIQERHAIYLRRKARQPKPWTQDRILQMYRFCNIYRELDSVTVWIAQNWRRDEPDVWFAMTLARFFNLPATLELAGYPVPFRPERLQKKLQNVEKIFNAAYMVRSDPGSKLEYVLNKVLTPLWRDRAAVRPRKGDTLAQFYNRLVCYYGMGSFMAGQVIADTKFVGPLKNATDWWTWATMGPGSSRGMNYVLELPSFTRHPDGIWEQKLKVLQTKIDPLTRAADMPRISAQDLQSCLCEYSKYRKTELGEGRPKQRYEGV